MSEPLKGDFVDGDPDRDFGEIYRQAASGKFSEEDAVTPEISRYVGKLMNTKAIGGLTQPQREAFIANVSESASWGDITPQNAAYIRAAEIEMGLDPHPVD